jgi:hypothetical protein
VKFTIDFLKPVIELDAYTIRSVPSGKTCAPSEWVLSGSTDGTKWFEIDRQHDVNLDAMALNAKTFTLVKKTQLIRAVSFVHPQTRIPMAIAAFEIFGCVDCELLTRQSHT